MTAELPPEAAAVRGRALITQFIDPEIREFETYFSQKKVAGSGIMAFEKELLRSYLYWKATGGVK